MSTSTLRAPALSAFSLLLLGACDPCADDPGFCMPGAPVAEAIEAEDAEGDTDGEDDDRATRLDSRDDDDAADEGGEGGGEGGDGESGAAEGPGDSEPDPGAALACWVEFDTCMAARTPEIECMVDLRECSASVGSDMPDGECLGSIAACLEHGGNLLACVETMDACSSDGVDLPWSDPCDAGHAYCMSTMADDGYCDGLYRACESPAPDINGTCRTAFARCTELGQPASVCETMLDVCQL